MKLWQSQGNNPSISDNIQMKLHVHNQTMVMHIHYTFHETPFIGSKVMAEDRKNQ